MAEGGPTRHSLTPTIYKGSEELFDVICSPCFREGNNAEAVNFCANCSEYFCQSCTKHHSKFGTTAGHSVVGRAEAEKKQIYKSTGPLPTETCSDHPGEILTNYCADHDAVVCCSCVTGDHRSCNDVSHILNVSGDSEIRENVPKVESSLKDSLNDIDSTETFIHTHKKMADEDKNKSLLNIRENTERLLDHTRDMEKKAIDEVIRHHTEITKTLDADLTSLHKAKATIKNRLKSLGDADGSSDSQVFVDSKKGLQEAEATKNLKQHAKNFGAEIARFSFEEDERFDKFLKEFSSIGKLMVNKPYKANLKGSYCIEKNGGRSCQVFDMCELSDGRILMTDFSNRRILTLDQSYHVAKSFDTQMYGAHGICQTNKHEVAVALTYAKKVQFVDVRGNWKMTKTFDVQERCRGIALSKQHLLVSCFGQAKTRESFVAVYDMSGLLCHKFQADRLGRQMFVLPNTIALTDNGNKIHVGNGNGIITTLDGHFNILTTFSENDECFTCMSVIDDSNLIACGYYSGTIFQINTHGELVTKVLSHEDGLSKPTAILYSRNKSTLVVAFDRSNEIKVFDLSNR